MSLPSERLSRSCPANWEKGESVPAEIEVRQCRPTRNSQAPGGPFQGISGVCIICRCRSLPLIGMGLADRLVEFDADARLLRTG